MVSPGIHVLIIGTSAYERGRHWREPDLPGSALSAARFAQFMAHSYLNPDPNKIVQTIRLLLEPLDAEEDAVNDEVSFVESGDDYTNPSEPKWSRASRDSVQNALYLWAADCDSHPENIAVLYVAGHGVGTAGGVFWAFLTAVGRLPDPYINAVNLDAIRGQMKQCRARHIYYIFDACRTTGRRVPIRNEFSSSGLTIAGAFSREHDEIERLFGSGENESSVVISARSGTATYIAEPKDGPIMTWALLPLLRGEAGSIVRRTYVVTVDRIRDLLPQTMSRYPDANYQSKKQDVSVLGQGPAEGVCIPVQLPNFTLIVLPDENSRRYGLRLSLMTVAPTSVEVDHIELRDEPVELRPQPAGVYKVRGATMIEPVEPFGYNLDLDRNLRFVGYEGPS